MAKFANKKFAIIGGGHICLALAEGLLNSGKISGSQLIVSTPSLTKITHLKKLGVKISTDNKLAALEADWIFLAVKPLIVERVLSGIKDIVENKLIISLAAGVSIDRLLSKTGNTRFQIVRIMPNIAISHNQGVIGLFSKQISSEDKTQLRTLLSSLGSVIDLNREIDLDTLTLVSACGPALVAYFITLLTGYGNKLGLSSVVNQELVLQTFRGTALYLEKSNLTAHELIEYVATKGGVTESILSELEGRNFQGIFANAMDIGYGKIKELDKKMKKWR